MRRSIAASALLSLLFFASCGGERPGEIHDGHGLHEAAASATAWSDSLELFVEYAPDAHGSDAVFLVHLTRLADFSPLAGGEVTVTICPGDGSASSRTAPAPLRKGIWEIEASPPPSGDCALAVRVAAGDAVERFDLPAFFHGEDHAHVAPEAADGADTEHAGHDHDVTARDMGAREHDAHDHDVTARDDAREHDGHDHDVTAGDDDARERERHDDHDGRGPALPGPEKAAGVETISFLKEQQWNTGFRVSPARRTEMRATIPATATVAPRPDGYAEIISPVDGLLLVSGDRRMVSAGVRVTRGDAVAILGPPPGGDGSWMDMHLGYRRAREEFRRAERLLEHEAISPRDFAAIRDEWLVRKASYESILRDGFVEPVEDSVSGELRLLINTPVGGVVASIDVMPGQAISAGQRLLTVVDPAVVRLEADLFERDFYRLGEPRGASISVPGLDETITAEGAAFEIVGRGDLYDAETGTIPVVFETPNPGRLLKIGQVVRLDIFTDEAARRIAVPASAIVDEDYGIFVFVQTAGESFEKRPVRTGARWRGLVALEDGVAEGERVVVEGAYALKLAATSGTIAQPHVH